MAIVGFKYDPEGVDSIYYAITDDYPKAAKRIRWLLVAALFLSLVSAFQSVDLSGRAYTGSGALAKESKALAEDPALRAALAAQLKLAAAKAEARAPVAGEPPPKLDLSAIDVEDSVQRGVDALSMLSAFTGDLMLGFMVVLIFFPIKYSLLWRGVRKGNPDVLTQIRRTARSQCTIEFLRMFFVWDMNNQATTLELPNSWSWSLVVGLLLLWYARRAEVREFFSSYVIKPAPKDFPIPAVATQGGLTSDVFPSVSEDAEPGPAAAPSPAADGPTDLSAS